MMRFGGMMGASWLIWIVLVGVVIYLIINRNNSSRDYSNSSNHNTPLEILKERYAKGEISEEEYIRKKEILKS